MKDELKPRTLTKIGNTDENLQEAIRRFNPGFTPLPKLLGSSEKYGLYIEERPPYLITVSKSLIGKNERHNYNLMLCVTSEFERRNREMAKEFERKSGIKLRAAPRHLERLSEVLNYSFAIFKRHGSRAMDVLKTMGQ